MWLNKSLMQMQMQMQKMQMMPCQLVAPSSSPQSRSLMPLGQPRSEPKWWDLTSLWLAPRAYA